MRWKRREIEAAAKDNVSSLLPVLSVSRSLQALNNLKLYSTAGDKVNQTAESLSETGARSITARYLTLCDKTNMQHTLSSQRGQFPRWLCEISAVMLHLYYMLSFGDSDALGYLSCVSQRGSPDIFLTWACYGLVYN